MKYLFLILFLAGNCFGAALSALRVRPNDTVEVGELVQFAQIYDGNIYTGIITDTLKWTCSDGYKMGSTYPWANSARDGSSVVHHFMTPGNFTVKCVRTTSGGVKDSVTSNIHVDGVAPAAGFELWHAPFHARISQKCYVKVPTVLGADSLKVDLTKNGTYYSTLFTKVNPDTNEMFVFYMGELGIGNYVMRTTIKDGGDTISVLRDKFPKNYSGNPPYGFDLNNAVCSSGVPILPVSGFLVDVSKINHTWQTGSIGMGYVIPGRTVAGYREYLHALNIENMYVYGPTYWEGWGDVTHAKNGSTLAMENYVNSTKDSVGHAMWSWYDEPDYWIPPLVQSSWMFSCHYNDQKHPMYMTFGGAPWTPYATAHAASQCKADFLNNDTVYGGKHWFTADMIGFDLYPFEYCNATYLTGCRGIEAYAYAFDRCQERQYNLIPVGGFVEVQEITRTETPVPTPDQIIMMCWVQVIHGSKTIEWFQYFGVTPAANITAMASVKSEMDKWGHILVGTPSTQAVSDNCNTPTIYDPIGTAGNRVDISVREHGDSTYIFAVRVTEPSGYSGFVSCPEPTTLTTTFTVPGIAGKTVHELTKNRNITAGANSFIDTLGKNSHKVYSFLTNEVQHDTTLVWTKRGGTITMKDIQFGTTGTVKLNSVSMTVIQWTNDSVKISIPSWMPRGYYSRKIYNGSAALIDSVHHKYRVRTPIITGGE